MRIINPHKLSGMIFLTICLSLLFIKFGRGYNINKIFRYINNHIFIMFINNN